MKHKHPIERRKFLKLSSAAVLTGFTGKLAGNPNKETLSVIEDAAQRVGQFPRRKLGYSQREVSVIIGSGDLAQLPREAGFMCGMNYWHKADQWKQYGAPENIIRNRDAHICQVNIDRVGGNNAQAYFDEEEHYRFVKDALQKTGLRYFDDMQLHYGYRNKEELLKERGFVRAFERLKKEGLVKYLCLSQHSYEGSPGIKNGQSAAEVLTAVVEDGLYEHAQIMYSYDDDPEMNKFLEFARKKKFGMTAMKTARGIGRLKQDVTFMSSFPKDTTPHNALLRWLTTKTLLDAIVMRVKNLEEFIDSYSGAGKDLRAQDARTLEIMAARINMSACRLCGKCQSQCPQHIPITDILRFERYAMDDYDWNKAGNLYAELTMRGDQCISCNSCVQRCPLNLKIPEKMSRIHAMLGSVDGMRLV
jgi:predicted aldo/keto reductase-like oxidoreductase